MRYYLDEEFLDIMLPKNIYTIDLVSIALIAEDGRDFYAQSVEFDASKASPWVKEHVFPHLDRCPSTVYYGYQDNMEQHKAGNCGPLCPWYTRAQIKDALLSFMDIEQYGTPEVWTYFGAYDWVAFCQLFGTMIDLPNGFPMLSYDFRQWLDMHGLQNVRQPDEDIHHAFHDAVWLATTYAQYHGPLSRLG